MSKVALTGNASGTGTLTVAAPNTNSDYTLTLPESTGTMATQAYVIAALAATFTQGTEQATTSGTAFDFTGIPAGVNRVTVTFRGVSLTGTDSLLIQIGDSGGIETSGYTANGVGVSGGGSFVLNSTAGFPVAVAVASFTPSGAMTLTRSGGNDWVASHALFMASTQGAFGGGTKTLSGELTQLRVTRTSTNTFDAGAVNIAWE